MIPAADRTITRAQAERIDQGCRLTPGQVRILRAVTDLRAAGQESRQEATRLELGKNVRRWRPNGQETANLRSGGRIAALVKRHAPRLADALKLASIPATASVIRSVYTDSYGWDSNEAPTDATAPRLASLMAEASNWAASIFARNPDMADAQADTQAASVAQDAAVAGDNASTLDTADANGSQVRFVLDSDSACDQCREAAGTYDPNADDLPSAPIHRGCQCSYEEVGS